MSSSNQQTVILGGGFTGLFTALYLSQHQYSGRVLLIDQSERFIFKPLLYEFLNGQMDGNQVWPRYQKLLHGSGVTFVQDTVQQIDLTQRKVELISGLHSKFIRISHPLLSAVFLTALLLSACGKKDPAATAKGPPPAAVKLQTVGTATLKESAEFVGTLEAEERVTLQPQIQGRIERILVANGDRVEQGTLIAALSLDQTQANVASAASKTNSERSALATAQSQLQASEADRVSAQSDVKLQQIQFNRTKGLVSEGAQARQQLDVARNNALLSL